VPVVNGLVVGDAPNVLEADGVGEGLPPAVLEADGVGEGLSNGVSAGVALIIIGVHTDEPAADVVLAGHGYRVPALVPSGQ
jgi:hypothetical protein